MPFVLLIAFILHRCWDCCTP